MKNESLHAILHKLWTKAHGQAGYDKSEWKQLERLILQRDATTGKTDR